MATTVDQVTGIKVEAPTPKQKSFGVDDFSATMSAIAPGVAEGVLQSGASTNSAAVTHAALTGVAGAPQAYGYGGAYGNPYSMISGASLGGGVPGLVGAATDPIGYGGGTLPSGLPLSAQGQENSYLIQAMQDSNMKMLVLQTEVQDVNKEFTLLSNLLQTKHQTEINSIRNTRVG